MTPEKIPESSPEAPATFVMPDDSDGFNLAELAGWHLLEKKGENLVVLDLRGRSDVCDFFVIAEGNSDVQVRALARNLQNKLLDAGHRAKGIEGMDDGRWVLIDFFDVVVHVFHPETRRYYQLEKLWGDAGRLDLDPSWFASPEVSGRHPGIVAPPQPGSGPAS